MHRIIKFNQKIYTKIIHLNEYRAKKNDFENFDFQVDKQFFPVDKQFLENDFFKLINKF